ncbi:MAG: protein kinase, partial [Acidobacteriota bacterium]
HEQMPYLVEEYLPGEDLAHMIRRREPETLEEKIDVLLQIASGLSFAHSQEVIHRDIKPSNIRILDNGQVKIMDFGTAKLANVESNLTQTGMTLGTVAYLSPERLLGRPSGTNSDLFSYGVLAYELLSFRRPFVGRNIPGLIDQVLNAAPVPLPENWAECPPELALSVHKCLSKDPQERYASCHELIGDLEQVRNEHCAYPPATRETTTTVVPADLRLSGLLEHARELQGRQKYQRAEILLDEVLEMDPGNAAARQLLARGQEMLAEGTATIATHTVQTSDPLSTHSGTWEEPAARRQRKIGEAVSSINATIDSDDLVSATEALQFAIEFLGEFDEAKALRQRLRDALGQQVAELREIGMKQARLLVEQMALLRQQKSLTIDAAKRIVERINELDPDDLAGRHIVAALHQDARRAAEAEQAAAQGRKKLEAIDSIERLLEEGDAEMAERALQFAIRLYGRFDQATELERRIAQVRPSS